MAEIIATIKNYLDDAWEDTDGGFYDHDNFLQITNPPSWPPAEYAGLRFQLNIPQGAIIDSAIINVYPYWSYNWGINVYGNAIDNAENFGDNPHIISEVYRPRTITNAEWLQLNFEGERANSQDIKSIIQEIISRSGWVENNYLTLLLVPMSSDDWALNFLSYDGGGEVDGPRLTINYHLSAGAPIYSPNKQAFTGYHCFMKQYIKNKEAGALPLKLPDGTLW